MLTESPIGVEPIYLVKGLAHSKQKMKNMFNLLESG